MLPILTLHSLFSLTPLAQKKLLRIAKLLSKKETPRKVSSCGSGPRGGRAKIFIP